MGCGQGRSKVQLVQFFIVLGMCILKQTPFSIQYRVWLILINLTCSFPPALTADTIGKNGMTFLDGAFLTFSPSHFVSRDFAFVARDSSTGKHKCHMFRCHGSISGRAITNALHDLCSKILEKKKKAQESDRKMSVQKPWSDIINTPPPSSARGTDPMINLLLN